MGECFVGGNAGGVTKTLLWERVYDQLSLDFSSTNLITGNETFPVELGFDMVMIEGVDCVSTLSGNDVFVAFRAWDNASGLNIVRVSTSPQSGRSVAFAKGNEAYRTLSNGTISDSPLQFMAATGSGVVKFSGTIRFWGIKF